MKIMHVRKVSMKRKIWWVVLLIVFFMCSVSLSAQMMPSGKKPGANDLSDILGLNLGVVPDNTGNLSMDTGFDFNYGKLIGINWLTFGASYTKTDTTQTTEEEDGQIKKVTNVKQQIVNFQPVALKFDFGNFMTIKPGGNVQFLSQKRKFNLTDRTTDTFGNEESKLRSIQANGQLEAWVYLGTTTFYLTGSFNPFSKNDETALGYDSIYISEKDSEGNDVYEGYTGDYSYSTSTESSYYDIKGYLNFRDVFLGTDIYLEGKYVYLSYDYTSTQSMIYNGSLETYTETQKFEKKDLSAVLGIELAFIDFGSATPLATFNYTYSQMSSGDNQVFGAGILLLQ